MVAPGSFELEAAHASVIYGGYDIALLLEEVGDIDEVLLL